MKSLLLIATMMSVPLQTIPAQPRYVGKDFETYYRWFNARSQAADLYTDGSTLIIFADHSPVHVQPNRLAKVITHVDAGKQVRNHVGNPTQMPVDEVNGYQDLWYLVTGKDANGQAFRGYVWGAHVARGWRQLDIDGDGDTETILLGVSSEPRRNFRDIKAELRLLRGGKMISQTTVPGLCVFEQCESSALLRIFPNQPQRGTTVIEASTMTVGCLTGIEKAFYLWNGQKMDRIYHAEYTTGHEYANTTFGLPAADAGQTMLCRYGREDANYNPVWDCKAVANAPAKADAKPPAARVTPRAR